MTYPLMPEGVDELARIYVQEYQFPMDRVKQLIEAREAFGASHKTSAVALDLLNQQVTLRTTFKAVTQDEAAVAQQPESHQP